MDKATLDEMNFRYNSPKAQREHKFELEPRPLDFRNPKVCVICGNLEEHRLHEKVE